MPGNKKPNRDKSSLKKRERERLKETRKRLRAVSILQEKYRVFTVEDLLPKLEAAGARVTQLEKALAEAGDVIAALVPHEPECKGRVATETEELIPCDCGKAEMLHSITDTLITPPPESVKPVETKTVEIKDADGNVVASGELPAELADEFNKIAQPLPAPTPAPDGGAL